MIDKKWYCDRIIDPCIRMYENILWERKLEPSEIEKRIKEEREYLENENVFAIPRIVIIVTTKCTLKCKGCSQLIPCYEKPYDTELEVLTASLDNLIQNVDKCYAVDIIGGEPFLYKNIEELVELIKKYSKICQISFATNGTVKLSPTILKSLKDNRVLVRVSDYGLIRKQAEFIEQLEKNDIAVAFSTDMQWVDLGDGRSKGRTHEELKSIFKDCNSGKMCKTLLNGRLYHCSRCANLYDLGMGFMDRERDLLEINCEGNLREKLKYFFLQDYSNACDNCDLAYKHYIPAGEQESQNIQQSSFTIISRRDFKIKEQLLKDCQQQNANLNEANQELRTMNNELRKWTEDLQAENERLRNELEKNR